MISSYWHILVPTQEAANGVTLPGSEVEVVRLGEAILALQAMEL